MSPFFVTATSAECISNDCKGRNPVRFLTKDIACRPPGPERAHRMVLSEYLSHIADDVFESAILTVLNVSLALSFSESTNYYPVLPSHFYFRQK
jgi:hypothetical protein